MELLQLRYFLTVAKFLNISRAAEYHRIPQPAMSQTISRLEKELGAPLFDRYKNKLSLTQKGEEFFQSVSVSLSELDAATSSMDRQGPLRGELTLLVQNHRDTMVDCIVAFRKLYPDVHFRVFYVQNPNEGQEYDLCICSAPPEGAYGESKCLITEKLQLMVAVTHPMAKKPFVSVSDLKDESFALLNKENSLWQHTEYLCHQAGFEPNISMLCGDLHCMIKYVAAGMAVTIGPVVSWQGLKNDSVVFVPLAPEARRATYLFQSKRRRNEQLRQVFVDFMTSFFASREAES